MKKYIAMVLLSVVLAGCNGTESSAKEAVKQILNDPSSAQFKNIYTSSYDGKPAACGEVNAKNAFGAYVGYKRFVYLEYPYPTVFFDGEEDAVMARIMARICYERRDETI